MSRIWYDALALGKETIVEALPDRYRLMALLATQTDATFAELMGRLGRSTPGAAMRYQYAAADRDAEIARRLSALVDSQVE